MRTGLTAWKVAKGLYLVPVFWMSNKQGFGLIPQFAAGDAVAAARPALDDWDRPVLILPGDVPLMTAATLRSLIERHEAGDAAITVGTMAPTDPTGYGRVVRSEDGGVLAIVEHRDCTPEQLEKFEEMRRTHHQRAREWFLGGHGPRHGRGRGRGLGPLAPAVVVPTACGRDEPDHEDHGSETTK